MTYSTWRRGAAMVTAGLLLLGAPTVATAQPTSGDFGGLEDLLDPQQLEDLLGHLDAEQLDQLLNALRDEDDNDNGDGDGDGDGDNPLPPELQAVLDQLLALLGEAGLPDPDGDDNGDDNGEGDGDGATAPTVGGTAGTPETGVGGFVGYAEANGTTICVGLPPALAEGLGEVLTGIGIAGSCDFGDLTVTGIRLDLGKAQADLRRAAADEPIDADARAFVTNAILAAEGADAPGVCQGGPMEIQLPPEGTPVVSLTLLGVDCAASDERAFADVQIAGADIRLGNLIEHGLPEEARDGLGQVVDGLNEQLLAELNPALCELSDPLLDGLLGGGSLCETDEGGQPSFLQLRNPLDVDVPLVDVGLVAATSEVVQDGEVLTATATSTLTGLNTLGIACLGGDGTEPYTFTATASTNGEEAKRSARTTDLQLRTCPQEQSLLRLIATDGPLGDIAVLEQLARQGLLGGSVEPVFDGIDELLGALQTQAITQGRAYEGEIEGAGTSAGTTPFVVAASLPMAGLPGLSEVGGEIAVVVHANETKVGVNAEPAEPMVAGVVADAPDGPDEPLPHTGAGLGGLFGLAALAGAFFLRRRD